MVLEWTEVLKQHYANLYDHRTTGLSMRGGFSGARVWRIETIIGPLCFKAWPPNTTNWQKLEFAHRLMDQARNHGLHFVPQIIRTRYEKTYVTQLDWHFELSTWMPGNADFSTNPSFDRLRSICHCLAQLHSVWSREMNGSAPCPAILSRIKALHEWQRLAAAGWQPDFGMLGEDIASIAREVWQMLPEQTFRISHQLSQWTQRSFPVQPCLCDIWHDHVLLEGERVTGVIDYGGVRMDNVAVDLARLLGSLVGNDRKMFEAGLNAYASLHPLSEEERALVTVLDYSGTVLAVCNWLRWLYYERRPVNDLPRITSRLAAMVHRLRQCAETPTESRIRGW